MFGCQMEKPILAENDVIIERKQAQLSVFLVPLKLARLGSDHLENGQTHVP